MRECYLEASEEGKIKLIHGSKYADLKFDKNDMWFKDSPLSGGLFFSDDMVVSRSFGDYLYVTEIDEDDICDERDIISNEDEVINYLTENYGDVDKACEIYDYIIDSITDRRMLGEYMNEIGELLECDIYTSLWELQGLSLRVAVHLGFKAVQLFDENGVVYFVSNPEVTKYGE